MVSDQNESPKEQPADKVQADKEGLDVLLPFDEHIELVSENGKKVRRKGIYLLPNLFTTGALFAGFYAVISAINGNYESASIAIFVAMFLDGLDGRVARLTNTQSAFGVQYDSLADMVSFGVAPSLVMFSWALSGLGKLGWAASFIYVACAALRLARFNTVAETADKRFFTGLASPPAAALLASMVWVFSDLGYIGIELPASVAIFAAFVTACVGVLMVANVPYHSFKGIDMKGRVPFVVILLVVLVFGIITIDPPTVLLAIAVIYALSGPAGYLFNRIRQDNKGA
jgi:CDP-diacylglycerol--serine O-phosphatidyltransferase